MLTHQSSHPEMIGSCTFGGSLFWVHFSTDTVIDLFQLRHYHVREAWDWHCRAAAGIIKTLSRSDQGLQQINRSLHAKLRQPILAGAFDINRKSINTSFKICAIWAWHFVSFVDHCNRFGKSTNDLEIKSAYVLIALSIVLRAFGIQLYLGNCLGKNHFC